MFREFWFQAQEEKEFGGCHGRGRHERSGGRGRGFGGPFGPFGPGFGGRHGGERGFGGRERMFDSGDLQLIILDLLAQKPSYGYELIKAIEERFAGGYAPSPGVVYPTLTMLEERGFAEVVSSEGNRKVYGVTEAGKAEIAQHAERLKEIGERVEHRGRAFERERTPQIMRAFRNLGEAVRTRMFRGDLTAEQVAKISEAIDAAARAIDQV